MENLNYRPGCRIRCGTHHLPHFSYPIHVHPEYEFTWFIKGNGRQLIGDHQGPYRSGDMLFLGPNLPHAWFPFPREATPSGDATLINLQFQEDIWGQTFWSLPEAGPIRALLNRSRFGLKIEGTHKAFVARSMRRIQEQSGFAAMLTLLEILHHLSLAPEQPVLSSLGYIPVSAAPRELETISRIHEYVMSRYHSGIQLEEAARISGLSKTAFCHFFKRRTGRSFSRFVNELRIKEACRALRESGASVAEIAFESGFSNLSHFNRCFRSFMATSPRRYRCLALQKGENPSGPPGSLQTS